MSKKSTQLDPLHLVWLLLAGWIFSNTLEDSTDHSG